MDDYIMVDPDQRTLSVPESETVFGVYGDNNAERKYFKCQRYVGDNIDLSSCHIFVNYISAATKIGQIECDVADPTEDDSIIFSWRITRNVIDKNESTKVFFAVQAKNTDGDTVFTTRKAEGLIYESIEGTETVQEEYADVILQLLSRMDKVEERVDLKSYGTLNNIGKTKKLYVSFTDDDCRIETYNKLFPVIKETGISYLLACPYEQIGTENYMSIEQLNEMRNAGCLISSHHTKQYAMNQFLSNADYDKELNKCDTVANNMNVHEKYICYPNGVYVSEYMETVHKHYAAGFLTDRGINELPIESYFLKRVEVFPRDSFYDIEFVKKYVDELETKDTGWLVLMTHSWYDTFNADQLKEIIAYIQSKTNVVIADVNTVLNDIGNNVEYGVMQKPMGYSKNGFLVIDAFGNLYSNSVEIVERPNTNLVKINAGYNIGYNLTPAGKAVAVTDKKRVVSSKFTVNPGEKYLISASNIYGNSLYCIYDSNDTVITAQVSDNSASGTVIKDTLITIPENAVSMRVASNMSIQLEMYSIFKLE